MSKLPIKNMDGKAAGEYEIADELLVFDKGSQAVHDAVVAYLANQRQGSANSKGRSEVKGSRAKPWRQKGTGRARAGTRQSPIWRGGGVAFGPKPRSFRKVLTKKALKLAFRRAFSEKVASGQVTVLDPVAFAEPKTKLFQNMLEALDIGSSALLVVPEMEFNMVLASRNIPKVEVMQADHVNVYQLLRYQQVLVAKDAMAAIEERLKRSAEAAAPAA